MAQKQLEHIAAPDTALTELERIKMFIIEQVESSTDLALMDLIGRLLLHEN